MATAGVTGLPLAGRVQLVRASGAARGCCHPVLDPEGTYIDVQESYGLHQDVTKYAQGVYTRQWEPVGVVEKVLSIHAHLERQTGWFSSR